MEDFNSLKALLDAYKSTNISSKGKVTESNIFEIAGYPHYENVVSNILAFFFDTEEQHGFKDCYIKSLINCYLKKCPRDDISNESINTNEIIREYSNGSDKRIDLLIDCGDFLVIIENKIYASLYNDLDVYSDMAEKYLDSVNNKGIPIIKIVLSLYEVNDIKQDDVTNITYDELIDELNKNLGCYQVSEKWRLFNQDFMDNIKRRKWTMGVNKSWIEFAKENRDAVSNFIDVYNEECQTRLDFCKKLFKAIKELDDSLLCGTYSGGRIDPYYSVYLNVKLSDGITVCLETYVMKKPTDGVYEDYAKAYMALWSRDRKSYEYLKRLVDLLGVETAIEHESAGWKEQYILQIHSLDSLDINKLAEDTVKYAQALKKE